MTGMVIDQGNLDALVASIRQMEEKSLSPNVCRKRAEEYFDKDKCFKMYLDLYETLVNISK